MPQSLKSSLMGKHPVFRHFLLAWTFSNLGTNLFDFAMPLYVYERTRSVFAMSMVYFCLYLPHFLMAPLTGYSADQFDRRKLLIAADLIQVALLLALWVHPFSLESELAIAFLAVFFLKSMGILSETVYTFQLVPALVSRDDLSEANTWFLTAQRILQIVGPLLGGVLMSTVGINGCIVGNLVSFVATLHFAFRVKHINELIHQEIPGSSRKPVSVGHFFQSFFDGINFVLRSPVFRPFVYLMFFWNLCSLIPRTPSVTYFFTESVQYSPFLFGVALAVVGVFEILAYIGGRSFYRQHSFSEVFIGSATWQAMTATIALVFAAFFPSALPFVMCLSLSRMGSSWLTMGTFLLRQTLIPRHRSGTVNSCIRMLFMSGAPLSSIGQGWVIHHMGVGWSFAIGVGALWAVSWYSKQVAEAMERQVGTRREAEGNAA